MENNKRFITTILIMSLIVSSSCMNKMSTTKNNINNEKAVFVPDTTINGELILDNSSALKNFYTISPKIKLVSALRESPVVIFFNNDQTEYLLAYQYEGNTENAFSCFEVGYTNKELFRNKYSITQKNRFTTENKIGLGITLNKLISIKGNAYTLKPDSTIVYQIGDFANDKYLQQHNMPAYFLECAIKNSKVSKIKFGFVQP